MISSSPSIGIGIATKDRWDDIRVTLTRLRQEGLDTLQTIVADDGSQNPVPESFRTEFPWVRFERFEKSEGVCPRRNFIASQLTTEFYLSLDDDSFPVAGDLAQAATWMRDHPDAAALAFRIIFEGDPVPDPSEAVPPQKVRDFVGCAALLRRELLLKLGAFETRLYFYHEEPEYCFRSFQAGYNTYAYPSVVMRHMVTTAARRYDKRTRFFIRNIVVMDLWYYPHPQSILRAIGHMPLLLKRIPKLREHWWIYFCGWLEGFECYWKWRKLRTRFTPEQEKEWNSRPVAVHACMGSRSPFWK